MMRENSECLQDFNLFTSDCEVSYLEQNLNYCQVVASYLHAVEEDLVAVEEDCFAAAFEHLEVVYFLVSEAEVKGVVVPCFVDLCLDYCLKVCCCFACFVGETNTLVDRLRIEHLVIDSGFAAVGYCCWMDFDEARYRSAVQGSYWCRRCRAELVHQRWTESASWRKSEDSLDGYCGPLLASVHCLK